MPQDPHTKNVSESSIFQESGYYFTQHLGCQMSTHMYVRCINRNKVLVNQVLSTLPCNTTYRSFQWGYHCLSLEIHRFTLLTKIKFVKHSLQLLQKQEPAIKTQWSVIPSSTFSYLPSIYIHHNCRKDWLYHVYAIQICYQKTKTPQLPLVMVAF